ncbi:MAG TPA: C39 family peptidase [Candidatus Dormibacteraeota bacterium]
MGRGVAAAMIATLALACGGTAPAGPAAPTESYQAQVHRLDCEAAALQMVLAGRGIHRSQDALLQAFGRDPRPPEINPDGSVSAWGDPYAAFVGDPDGSESDLTGYGVYYPPVAAAARAAGGRIAEAGEAVTPDQLYAALAGGKAAVVWVSFSPATQYAPQPLQRYKAFDGRDVPFGQGFEHAVALAGVRADAVYVFNPEPGMQPEWLPKSTFEPAYANFGQMAVVLA